MTLDRYNHSEAGDAARAEAPAPEERAAWLARRGVRRLIVAGAGLLIFAAPALAVTQPWSPAMSRPNIDKPVSTSAAPVASQARDALAVLRRPQAQADRDGAEPLLRTVGVGNQLDGVQTSDVRALPGRWALVPVTTARTGPASVASNQICITNGELIGCAPASGMKDHGTAVAMAAADRSTYAGLVPDGVTRVRFVPKRGSAVEGEVTSNFYTLTVPGTEPAQSVPAPPGYSGGRTIPGPTMPLDGSIELVDTSGRVVGPAG